MTTGPLYVITVETGTDRQNLLRITGSRETVIETALRVILDSAPSWDPRTRMLPTFTISVFDVK